MNDDQQMMGNAQQGNQSQQPQAPGGQSGPQQRPQPVSDIDLLINIVKKTF